MHGTPRAQEAVFASSRLFFGRRLARRDEPLAHREPRRSPTQRLAVTQIGTTQDITLRSYLAEHGLRDATPAGT